MSSTTQFMNDLLSLGTIAGHAAIIFLVWQYFSKKETALSAFISRNGILFALLIAVFGTAMSLVYSEVIGYAPCALCWYQRVFLYPLVLMFGYSLWKKDYSVRPYALILSAAGGLIALYQSYLQYGGVEFIPCSAAADAISCSQRYVFEFGYITLPLMAFTAFALIFIFVLIASRKSPEISA